MDGDGGSGKGAIERLSDEQRQHAVTMLSTEQFTLQTARSATIAESGSRAILFLGTVSSAVVALAFIGQVSGIGTAFYVFGLVLMPTLFFLGIVTFARVLQTGIEDITYALGTNRIRHFYVELIPPISPYFILSAHDDRVGTAENIDFMTSRWQMFLTTAGMVGVINSVIAGVFAGLLASLPLDRSLAAGVGVGMVVFVLSAAIHHRLQRMAWDRMGRLAALFPREPESPH